MSKRTKIILIVLAILAILAFVYWILFLKKTTTNIGGGTIIIQPYTGDVSSGPDVLGGGGGQIGGIG